MDWSDFRDHGRLAARQARTLQAIVTYRYLAPAYLAHEERWDQTLAACAQERLCDEGSAVAPPAGARGRRSLGGWITGIGRALAVAWGQHRRGDSSDRVPSPPARLTPEEVP